LSQPGAISRYWLYLLLFATKSKRISSEDSGLSGLGCSGITVFAALFSVMVGFKTDV